MRTPGTCSIFNVVFFILTAFICLPYCAKQRLKPNDRTKEEMIHIPSGEFIMGSNIKKDPTGGVSPYPERTVYLGGYSISKYETTNQQYYQFVLKKGYKTRHFWDNTGWQLIKSNNIKVPRSWINSKNTDLFLPDKSHAPVYGVSWYEAAAYAKYRNMRLPAEEEWEKAARGTDGRKYPWGNDFDKYKCNVIESQIGSAMPVGGFLLGKSPYGVMDMCGNIEEWTKGPYYNKKGEIVKGVAIVRGGAWQDPAIGSAAWSRHAVEKSFLGTYHYGFRLAN